MARRRKFNIGRFILVLLILVALVVLVIFGIKLFKKDETSTSSNDTSKTSVVEEASITIKLDSYDVYQPENLDFNFVVATLTFKGDDGVNYNLSNLVTEQGNNLSDIFEYEKMLKTSYDFDSLGTTVDVVSSENKYSCKVFIPYTGDLDTLKVTDKLSGESFDIDLTKNIKELTSTEYSDNSAEIVSDDYDISVSDNYISTMMTLDGDDYDNSMTSVYTFKLTVNDIKSGIKITGATFVQSNTNAKFDALSADYSSYKIDNIIGKNLKKGDVYALFFEVYSNEEEKPDYTGTITLKFSDGTSKELDTRLR